MAAIPCAARCSARPVTSRPNSSGMPRRPIASDVFSLGAVLYHLLAGHAPFEGGSVAETLAHVAGAEVAPLPADVPRDLAAICARCLAREPAHRYATAADLARISVVSSPRVTPPSHGRLSPLEKRGTGAAAVPRSSALIVLLTAVTVVAFVMIDAARRSEIAARTRLEESLDRIELDHAEDLFRIGDSANALAPLMRVIRRNPAHPVAGRIAVFGCLGAVGLLGFCWRRSMNRAEYADREDDILCFLGRTITIDPIVDHRHSRLGRIGIRTQTWWYRFAADFLALVSIRHLFLLTMTVASYGLVPHSLALGR